jgi:hypothetical protein
MIFRNLCKCKTRSGQCHVPETILDSPGPKAKDGLAAKPRRAGIQRPFANSEDDVDQGHKNACLCIRQPWIEAMDFEPRTFEDRCFDQNCYIFK